MMSICYKEKLKIPPDTLSSIITNTDNDIRLTLNHLSIFAAGKDNLNTTRKYIKMVIFYSNCINYLFLLFLLPFIYRGHGMSHEKFFLHKIINQ